MVTTTSSDYYSGSTTLDYVWHTWTSTAGTAASSTSSSVTANDIVWSTWVDDSCTYTDSSPSTVTIDANGQVWLSWSAECEIAHEEEEKSLRERNRLRIEREKEARAIRRDRAKEVRRMRLEQEKLRKERDAAEEKAKELLEILIGKDEMKVYEETGRVFVKGKDADYHIVKGGGYNIRKIEKDSVRDLCVHLQKRCAMPETDNVVALLLNLQADEKEVIKMANDWGFSQDSINNLPKAAVAGGR